MKTPLCHPDAGLARQLPRPHDTRLVGPTPLSLSRGKISPHSTALSFPNSNHSSLRRRRAPSMIFPRTRALPQVDLAAARPEGATQCCELQSLPPCSLPPSLMDPNTMLQLLRGVLRRHHRDAAAPCLQAGAPPPSCCDSPRRGCCEWRQPTMLATGGTAMALLCSDDISAATTLLRWMLQRLLLHRIGLLRRAAMAARVALVMLRRRRRAASRCCQATGVATTAECYELVLPASCDAIGV